MKAEVGAFGRYKLLQRLATGGMGEVYLARAPGTRGFEKTVVIKRILPHLAEEKEFLELFLDEARIVSQLNHPNIAQIFELGEVDGSWYLTMEYVAGQDLRRLLFKAQTNGHRTLPLGLTLRIISDAAAALDYAHRARDAEGKPLNIVHRDVSPHNVLVGFDGGVKLIDFGVAKAANRLQHTATGLLRGKFPYMSPEQVEAAPLDGRADVFSLGIVLWEALTGSRLFRAENDAATVRLVMQCKVEPPSKVNPDVPVVMDAIVLKALEREPARRFQSAGELRLALEDVILKQHLAASSAHLEAFMRRLFNEELTREVPAVSEPFDSSPGAMAKVKAPAGDSGTVPLRARPAAGKAEGAAKSEGADDEATATVQAGEAANAAGDRPPTLVVGAQAAPRSGPSESAEWAKPGDVKSVAAAPGAPVSNFAAPGSTVSASTQALLEELVGRKTNLAVPQTRFIGRVSELRAIAALFDRGERLVTLLGPGGTGKTRLADQFAERKLGAFGRTGGAWWCDLTEAQDVEGICLAVGRALSVTIAPGRSAPESVAQLAQAIRARGEVLLVLDNFEQIIPHARATVAEWFAAAPQARFIVTSREPLGISGEAIFEVPPLQLPEGVENAEDAEAVQLFLDRARAVRPGYAPTPQDLASIVEMVRQLDGLALAIELAAARMAVLSPAQMAQRLPRRFELLKGGGPGVTPRQATLKGAIDWSWRLLQPHEQSAFAQLAAFRGGFTLEAAEAVLSLERFPDAPWALDVVQTLKSKSLVRSYAPPGHPEELRFGLLESIREYASDRLRESTEDADAFDRHAEYYVRVGIELAEQADGPQALAALDRLQLERENLFQVFQRATEAAQVTTDVARRGLKAVLAVAPLMLTRGPFTSQLAMFDVALRRAEGRVDPVLYARGLAERGRARMMRGKLMDSVEDFHRALDLFRDSDGAAKSDEGRVLHFLANAERLLGRKREALEGFKRALTVMREVGDRHLEARVLGTLASMEQELGNVDEAARHYERALALHRELGDRRFEGIVLGNLGALEQDRGRTEHARQHYDQALSIHAEVGNRRSEGVVLANLGALYRDLGLPEEARAHYRRAVAIHREVGDRRFEGIGLAALGALEHEAGKLADAQVKFEQAMAILRDIGDRVWEALARGGLAALLADEEQFEAADAALREAETAVKASNDPATQAAVAIYRAHAEWAQADVLTATDAKRAERLRNAARDRLRAAEQHAESSANVRDALRCLRARHDLRR